MIFYDKMPQFIFLRKTRLRNYQTIYCSSKCMLFTHITFIFIVIQIYTVKCNLSTRVCMMFMTSHSMYIMWTLDEHPTHSGGWLSFRSCLLIPTQLITRVNFSWTRIFHQRLYDVYLKPNMYITWTLYKHHTHSGGW